jgi:shikimate kinase
VNLPLPNAEPVRLVCLIGFMGAGKTTVGRGLAAQLHWNFVDLDDAIESFERASISDIFSRSGQASFRKSESEALRRVLETGRREPLVLAIGGGAFSKLENQQMLQAVRATIVFLSAPEEELWQRVNTQVEVLRPLARDRVSFSQRLARRMPHFAKAHLAIETGGRSIAEVAQEIAERLGL